MKISWKSYKKKKKLKVHNKFWVQFGEYNDRESDKPDAKQIRRKTAGVGGAHSTQYIQLLALDGRKPLRLYSYIDLALLASLKLPP